MTRDFLTHEGDKYGDFTLINCRYIDELKATLREMIHKKSGANVMHIENDDPENLFCLSFKTLPTDSCGVPHILEHTVLCGSRKFPVKDPFFSMTRRSLNTFMNALTGADFTCYPAASQVEKDFYNLLEVYIDAVFHPLLKEQNFWQEGHHLAFSEENNPKSPLEYRGIVYNEMKGSMSSIDSRIWQSMMAELVPHLTYAHNSGGDPKDIPKLRYSDLLDFHETYYHPSRCLFFFYGNLSLKKHLDFLEEHALKNAQLLSPLDGIGHQVRFSKPVTQEMTYPTDETEKLENKHIHAFGWLTAPLLDQEDILALSILDSVLMDTDASPLKKALLDSELCVQADSFLDNEMTEVPLMLMCRGCYEKKGEKLKAKLFDTLKTIAKEGIPYALVEASIHQLEFSRKEIGGGHSPFGLTLFMRSALAKQHGCSPELSLSVHTLFLDLLEKAKDPLFFSPLIEKYLLNNSHFVHLCYAPDPFLTQAEAAEEKQRLKKIQSSLTDKEKIRIMKATEDLAEFQEHAENQSVECLPKVTLDDVPIGVRHHSLNADPQKQLTILHHDVFTNHIIYADLIFDLLPLSEEELFDLQLFLILWSELGVANRSFEENLRYMHAHTGGVGAHCSLHVQADNPQHMKPSLQLRGKALERKIDKLFPLMAQFINSPRLDETKRIEELIKKLAISLQNRLSQSAMRYATQLSLAGVSPASHINEKWYGLSFYQKLQSLGSNLSEELPATIDRLKKLTKRLLAHGKGELVLSCDQHLYDTLDKHGFYGLTDLPSHPSQPWDQNLSAQPRGHSAYTIASPVAFTAYGFRAPSYQHPDAPALLISTSLLENKVLLNRIREKGGAYGAGAHYNSLWGNFYMYAYRDPHIARSLSTFRDAIFEVCGGHFTPRDLEEAKLGIIQQIDIPTSPGNRAINTYTWMRDGKTIDSRQMFRDRLLSTTEEDVQKALNTHLIPNIDKGVITTFAGKELLEKELPLIEEFEIPIHTIS